MIKATLVFYRKYFFLLLFISGLIGIFVGATIPEYSISNSIGNTYLFLFPIFHLYYYEIKYENEYYYYYNLGLNKLYLWFAAAFYSLLIYLIFIIL